MCNFNASIGKRIKTQRLAQSLTRENLAQLAKISDKFLYDIEVGNKGISAKTLQKITKALNVTADWLLNG